MALGELHLIRREIKRLQSCAASDAEAHVGQEQQTERQARWADSLGLSQYCRHLCSDVTAAQAQSEDRVFARQVPSICCGS